MKAINLLLLPVFLLICCINKAQPQKIAPASVKGYAISEFQAGDRPISEHPVYNTKTNSAKITGATCPSSPLSMSAVDTNGNSLSNNTTVSCAVPFRVSPSNLYYAPCIDTHYEPSAGNLGTNGQETVYINGHVVYSYCSSGCNATISTASGGIADNYLYHIDSSRAKILQFCNTGTVGPTTITIQNCWDGTTLVGPVAWSENSTAPCFTITVPPNLNTGTAFYTIVPASGYPGLTNIHNGDAYVDPNQMPAGTYTLTYHFKGLSTCPIATGTYIFTVPVKPNITIAQSLTPPCAGTAITFTASGAGTGGTYTWSPGNVHNPILSVTNSPTVSTTYSYNVIGTSSTGCHGSQTATITVNPRPTLNVIPSPQSYTICNGGSVTFTVSGANTYTWTPSTTLTGANTSSPTANPSSTTIYNVTGTDANNCTNASPATVTVNVTAPPTITLTGNSYAICEGSSQTFTVSGATSYSWTPAATLTGATTANPTASPTSTTVYTVTGITSGCVPSAALTVTLKVNPLPTGPTLAGSTPNPFGECQGQSPKGITVTTGTVASTPLWYNGATFVYAGTTYVPNTTTTGTTIYTVIDSANVGGCKNLSANNILSVTVTINPTPTGPVIGATAPNPLIECQGQSPQTITVIPTGTVASTPVWYNGTSYVNTGTTYQPGTSNSGTIIYTVIDSANVGGCKNLSANSILNVTVTINPTPTGPVIGATATNPLTECQGQSPQTITVIPTGTVASTPVWYNGATYINTGTTYQPGTSNSGTTIYTLIDSANVGGCKNLSANNVLSVTVTINPTPTGPIIGANASNPLIECQGQSPQTITVIPTGAVVSTPVWYNGATFVHTGTTYQPSTAITGTTIYVVIDSANVGGCKNLSANNVLSVTVTINPTPTINVSLATKDTATCGAANGSILGLVPSDVSGGTQPYHYQWYSGSTLILNDTLLTLNHVTGGTYSLLVTDANGCKATVTGGTATFTVPVVPKPNASFSSNPPNPVVTSVPVNVTFYNHSTGATTYTWTFGDGKDTNLVSPSYTYTAINTYTVMLVAANRLCKDTAYATIVAEVPTTLIIPNIFSPNNDGINDEFFIVNTGVTSLSCDIFNRWGQVLYTLNAPNQAWDGRAPDGEKAPDGTYMYLLQAQGLNGKTYQRQGTITLIR